MNNRTDLVAMIRERLPQLGADEARDLASRVYDELEERVGVRLSEGLTDAQLEEFEKIIDSGDEAASQQWLVTTRPDYPDVVHEEMSRVLDEVVAAVSSSEAEGGPLAEVIDLRPGDHEPRSEVDEPVRRGPKPQRVQSPTPEDDAAIRLHDWRELKQLLHSRLACRLHGDDLLSTLIEFPEGRSQVVYVRDVNDTWAEASSAIGRALDSDAVSTALSSLAKNIGIGAITMKDMLVARHGLPYEGLTAASALRGVFAVARAADTAEQSATGDDEF